MPPRNLDCIRLMGADGNQGAVMGLSELVKETKASYWLARYSIRRGRRSTLAIDLGLNIGSFPLVYQKYFDTFIGVDASSTSLDTAKANLHGIRNVSFVHAAMSHESGKQVALRRVYVGSSWDSKDSTTIELDAAHLRDTGYQGVLGEVEETVESMSFPRLMEKFKIDHVDFLKVDMEGAEFDTFMGVDLSNVDALVMEVHYSFLGEHKVRLLVQHLMNFFEFIEPSQATEFLETWPPPDLLMMRRPNSLTPSMRLKLNARLFVTRTLRNLRRALRGKKRGPS